MSDARYDAAQHHVISNASCTTNCLAPVAKVLNDAVGVRLASRPLSTPTPPTSTYRTRLTTDLRRARAAAANLVPTSTGAAKAVGLVLPELQGNLHGLAVRAPVMCGSLVDFTFEAERTTTVDEVNAALRAAADEGPLGPIIDYTDEPIVSSDIVGNPHSAIADGALTSVIDGTLVDVVSWYDNEWGYSNRCVELLQRVLAAPALSEASA